MVKTRNQLEDSIRVLGDRLETATKTIEQLTSENSNLRYAKDLAQKRGEDLQQLLSDATSEVRQLRGYCDRVREEDALRVTGAPIPPPSEPPASEWYRSKGRWASYGAK